MSEDLEIQIKEIVDRETYAWNNKDTEKLLSIFHPDMVWPWPRTFDSHDPVDWVFEVGRFDYQRWKKIYKEFFKSHILVHHSALRLSCPMEYRLQFQHSQIQYLECLSPA
jgi:hypothetical protein